VSLFDPRLRRVRLRRAPMVLGMLPLSWLFPRERDASCTRLPMVSGIEPASRFQQGSRK